MLGRRRANSSRAATACWLFFRGFLSVTAGEIWRIDCTFMSCFVSRGLFPTGTREHHMSATPSVLFLAVTLVFFMPAAGSAQSLVMYDNFSSSELDVGAAPDDGRWLTY